MLNKSLTDPKLLNGSVQYINISNNWDILIYSRTKDGLFQAQTSRYLNEFEEIATLGKGSYGKVFKVRRCYDRILFQIY